MKTDMKSCRYCKYFIMSIPVGMEGCEKNHKWRKGRKTVAKVCPDYSPFGDEKNEKQVEMKFEHKEISKWVVVEPVGWVKKP